MIVIRENIRVKGNLAPPPLLQAPSEAVVANILEDLLAARRHNRHEG